MATADQITDVLSRAADIIEPHIGGKFKVRDRAEGAAQDLAAAGLLVGCEYRPGLVREQAVQVLQCRHNWGVSVSIADDLIRAGLLREER
ncbi:hypothetical protein AB0B94_30895 [Micromonospora sp. NPDC048986]|uniref:hypothetical protein n=1 Tax=Micromonospora sp. NPDC048986 TaxID=3155644 RepID=UPI0034047A5E